LLTLFSNMSDLNVIQTDKLGKKYLLDKVSPPDNLREYITALFRRSVKSPAFPYSEKTGELWALKNVDLQVKEGEILGIIGKNGAGKSTLLKVLSRVTEATEGTAIIRGRIASLLEIGIGFHPDLTGRENVFLNAALLGMKRAVVKSRFNDIVGFAGIGDFIDTQVKKYSSGMFVRLAFAIAAHLDSEIVFIDEVLAVGDSDFQKKCIAKIQSVAAGGRTVLFVSHNLAAVERLCSRCVVFDHGRIAFDGKTSAALDYYRTNLLENIEHDGDLGLGSEKRPGDGRARFQSLKIMHDEPMTPNGPVLTGNPVCFEIEIKSSLPIAEPRIAIIIKDQTGQVITRLDTKNINFTVPSLEKNMRIVCHIRELPLTARNYQIDLWLNERGQTIDYAEAAAMLNVCSSAESGKEELNKGLVEVPSVWQIVSED